MQAVMTRFKEKINSAQNILLILKTRRYFVTYPVLALISFLQEAKKNISIYSLETLSKDNILKISPQLEPLFVVDINKKTYFMNLKNKKATNVYAECENNDLKIQFDSLNVEAVSISDFEIHTNQKESDATILIGEFSNLEFTQFCNNTELGSIFYINKNSKNLNPKLNIIPIKTNFYEIIWEIGNLIKIEKNECNTYLLAGLLFETNQLTNEKTKQYWEIINKIMQAGTDLYQAQQLLPKITLNETALYSSILNSIQNFGNNILFIDISSFNLPVYLIEELKNYLIKIQNLMLGIIKYPKSPDNQNKYNLITTNKDINLSLIRKTYNGTGGQHVCKINTYKNEYELLDEIFSNRSRQVNNVQNKLTETQVLQTTNESFNPLQPANEILPNGPSVLNIPLQ